MLQSSAGPWAGEGPGRTTCPPQGAAAAPAPGKIPPSNTHTRETTDTAHREGGAYLACTTWRGKSRPLLKTRVTSKSWPFTKERQHSSFPKSLTEMSPAHPAPCRAPGCHGQRCWTPLPQRTPATTGVGSEGLPPHTTAPGELLACSNLPCYQAGSSSPATRPRDQPSGLPSTCPGQAPAAHQVPRHLLSPT